MADSIWQQPGADEPQDAGEPRGEKLVPGSAKPQHVGLPCGTGLGKYRILERIWTSHNAIAYKARDVMLDRLVSVKQMSPSLIDNPIACGHFKREAQFLARIPKDAAHVTRIHELIEEERGLFIVEEHVPGPRLETLVAKRHADLSRIVRLLRSAVKGLAVLHKTRIVHRDLNPCNLIVTERGGLVITNLASAAHEGDLTQPPAITPKYSAPELLLGKSYDDRIDIYSLGMVIYEVCVGRTALHAYLTQSINGETPTVGHWVNWQTNQDARLPDAFELNPLVPPRLSSILRRMTAKSLSERYTSVRDILTDMEPRPETGSNLLQLRSPGRTGPTPTQWPLALPGARHQMQESAQAMPWATSESLLAPLRPVLSTSTHTVGEPRKLPPSPAERRRQAALPPRRVEHCRPSDLDPVQPIGEVLRSPKPTLPPPLTRHAQLRCLTPPRRRALPAPHPEAIPKLQPAHEKHKEQRPHLLAWIVAALMLAATIGTGGGLAWYYRAGPGLQHPIENVFAEGLSAYQSGDLDIAEARFHQAASMGVEHLRFRSLQNRAKHMLPLIEIREALDRGDLAAAQTSLTAAERQGLNAAETSELHRRLWRLKDASRLEAESAELLEKGHYIELEAKLGEYKEKAEAAGVDPAKLIHQVEITRQDEKHNEAMAIARAELETGDWEKALRSIKDAERIRSTSETRDLHRRIEDAKRRSELILRGNRALQDQEFADAADAFEQANLIDPTPDIENKVKLARANLLCEKAETLIKEGDLLRAEQTLRSSLWQTKTQQAETRLRKMTPAFDAARLVKRADDLVQDKQYAEAIRLYEEALPNLPPPASNDARTKLARAKHAAEQQNP